MIFVAANISDDLDVMAKNILPKRCRSVNVKYEPCVKPDFLTESKRFKSKLVGSPLHKDYDFPSTVFSPSLQSLHNGLLSAGNYRDSKRWV